jgi:hypothetical protein
VTNLACRLAPVAIALALLGVGCANYRIGSSLPPDVTSVHVPTFVNRTGEPRLEAAATRATIARFQSDGTLSIADRESADVVMEVVLTSLSMEPLRFAAESVKTATEYRMTVLADMKVIHRASGEVILQKKRVKGEADFIPTGDLFSAKRKNLPILADDLSRRLVEGLVEFW